MVPEKKAVARRSGLRGHHSTWKAQLSAEGSYCVDACNHDRSTDIGSNVSQTRRSRACTGGD